MVDIDGETEINKVEIDRETEVSNEDRRYVEGLKR